MPNAELYMDRLVAAIDELTLPRNIVVSESYWDAMRHRKFRLTKVAHQPLLVDLALAVVPRASMEEDAGGGKPGSRPAARLEAIDELERIKREVLGWMDLLALPGRLSIAADLRALVGAALNLSTVTLVRLSRDARSWAMGARIVIGWEPPVFAPRVTCPACDALSTLRIYPAQAAARCVNCGATWSGDDGGIGILADHVRLESELTG